MSDKHQDKQPIDPVIRAALRARQVASSEACLDAETLAAWFDGGLDAAHAAAADAHLADCVRCQAMLAALSESADPATAAGPRGVVVPFAKPSSRIRWIAPIAAGVAAAGLLFWMIVPSRDSVSAPVSTLAESARGPVGQQTPATIPAPSTRLEQSPAAAVGALEKLDKQAPPQAATGSASKPTQTAAPTPLSIPRGSMAAPPQQNPKVTLAPPPAPSPAIAQARPAPAPVPTPPPPPTVVAGAADQALARADRNALKFEMNRKYPFEFAPPAPQSGARGGGGGAGGGGGGRAGGGVSTLRTTAPPAAPIRWRVLENGRLERTVNSGTTWTAVPLEGAVFITAGAAASPTVVWIVGREGVVFRSIDGATFARIDFPYTFDLEAVTALSVDRATVSTRDGRVFSTTDGGHTWRSN